MNMRMMCLMLGKTTARALYRVAQLQLVVYAHQLLT
ncbi:unnamed protein product [Arabidopsis halleri]